MDETSYDIPYYLDPNSGAYTGGTDMSGFYTDPWAGSSTDWSSLLGTPSTDPYGIGSFDFASLLGGSPADYGYSAPTTTNSWGDQVSLLDLANQANQPVAMSLGYTSPVTEFSPNVGQYMPDSSFVTSNGVEGVNPYSYMTGPSGDTYITDTNTGRTVGYLDQNGQPQMYGDIALQNGVPAAVAGVPTGNATTKLSGGAGSGASGGASGGSGNQQAKTPLQQGLSNAALIAQLLQLLQGKNAKAPAGIGTNQGATGMQWATGGLTSPLNAVRRG